MDIFIDLFYNDRMNKMRAFLLGCVCPIASFMLIWLTRPIFVVIFDSIFRGAFGNYFLSFGLIPGWFPGVIIFLIVEFFLILLLLLLFGGTIGLLFIPAIIVGRKYSPALRTWVFFGTLISLFLLPFLSILFQSVLGE